MSLIANFQQQSSDMSSFALVESDTAIEIILLEDDVLEPIVVVDPSKDNITGRKMIESLSAAEQTNDPPLLGDITNVLDGRINAIAKIPPPSSNINSNRNVIVTASHNVARKWLEMGKQHCQRQHHPSTIPPPKNANDATNGVDFCYHTPSQDGINKQLLEAPIYHHKDKTQCVVDVTGCLPLPMMKDATSRIINDEFLENNAAAKHRETTRIDQVDYRTEPVPRSTGRLRGRDERSGRRRPATKTQHDQDRRRPSRGRPQRMQASRSWRSATSTTIETSKSSSPQRRSHAHRPAPIPIAALVAESPCRSRQSSPLLRERELAAALDHRRGSCWHPPELAKSAEVAPHFVPRYHHHRYPSPQLLFADKNNIIIMAGSHWKSAQDPRTGRTYYYHEITRETQWRKPPELASEVEKKAMEDKERKQKDFFAAMEANILNSLSQGQVPGTPKPNQQDTLARRRSSRKPAERPELVRTISTMDHMVLKNLIQRQPSFRNISKNPLSKTPSLNPNDFVPSVTSRSSHVSANDFESFVSLMNSDHKERLDPLQESVRSNDDSMPELFSYLPDEGDYSVDGSMAEDSTVRSDAGKFNESSITGFGLTWEETQALKKLASITKEMIHAENEEFDFEEPPTKGAAGATPSWKSKDNKGMRDLPREIELDESDDDDDDESDRPAGKANAVAAAAAGNFQKAKDIGGRELDFDDSDEDDETTSDMAPTPMQKRGSTPATNAAPESKEALIERPEVKRRNTCGTLYVGTTMSAPDKDATIKCVCGVVRTHIISSESLPYDPSDDEFRIFNDLEAHQNGRSPIKFHNNEQPRAHVPSLDEVTRFYRDIFYKAQMETDCIIMSLIYVERLVKRTGGRLRPRAENWRSLLFSCMILSSKVWDDLSMWNADFSQSCPPGVSFPLKRINELELGVLNALSFQVKVPASEYAKYYFLLRSMLIKSGLGGEDMNALDPLDVMSARRMQAVSSQFENLSLGAKPGSIAKRSQSLNVAHVKAKQPGKPKLGLEQVVKM